MAGNGALKVPADRVFDRQQVRRAFGRAAKSYGDASALQQEIATRLMESLEWYPARHAEAPPARVLDVGCGIGLQAKALRDLWPKAEIIALDAALPMLHAAESNTRGAWLRRKAVQRVCADLRALPVPDQSVDVLFCNVVLQWVEDLPAAFAEFRRVLKPGGLLLASTFGQETLRELREAFAAADDAPHVSPFTHIAPFGDALIAAGFREPVLDRDLFVQRVDTFGEVMRELRAMGATNALHARRRSLSGRARFARAQAAYPRDGNGLFPISWEAIYAQAWAPEPGTPIRHGGVEIAQVPLSRIPIRRR